MNYVNIRTFLRDYAIIPLPVIVTRFGQPIFKIIPVPQEEPIGEKENPLPKTTSVKKDGVI